MLRIASVGYAFCPLAPLPRTGGNFPLPPVPAPLLTFWQQIFDHAMSVVLDEVIDLGLRSLCGHHVEFVSLGEVVVGALLHKARGHPPAWVEENSVPGVQRNGLGGVELLVKRKQTIENSLINLVVFSKTCRIKYNFDELKYFNI